MSSVPTNLPGIPLIVILSFCYSFFIVFCYHNAFTSGFVFVLALFQVVNQSDLADAPRGDKRYLAGYDDALKAVTRFLEASDLWDVPESPPAGFR